MRSLNDLRPPALTQVKFVRRCRPPKRSSAQAKPLRAGHRFVLIWPGARPVVWPAVVMNHKPGQPAAGELLLRVPVARRTLLKIDLAGSQGVAGTAATAQTDFDIQRNGTSIATMRFAAGGTTATLIAASETVLEPGDVLSVVAPTTPDTTLADIGFTLTGTLVL